MSVYEGHGVTLHHADCLDVLRSLPDCSVDSVVCDPPYGLEFMGKEWDSFRPDVIVNRGGGVPGRAAWDSTKMAPVEYGGAKQRSTLVCDGCGKSDKFRNAHDCPDGTGWTRRNLDTSVARVAYAKAFQDWCEAWATECLRVLKPGGHLLAFGGTRTWHRLACAVEDAGFEVRDSIAWLYGSGFPKSLDVSKAIDKRRDWSLVERLSGEIRRARAEAGLSLAEIGQATLDATDGTYGKWYHRGGHMFFETGRSLPSRPEWEHLRHVLPIAPKFAEVYDEAEREVIGERETTFLARKKADGSTVTGDMLMADERGVATIRETLPATDAAQQWAGWGTALKPAFEPVVVARKPLSGTVAQTVLQYGTGALNIAACRVGDGERVNPPSGAPGANNYRLQGGDGRDVENARAYAERSKALPPTQVAGRWPTNVVLDDSQAAALDEQSGESRDGVAVKRNGVVGGMYSPAAPEGSADQGYGGEGGASRFFPTFRRDEETSAEALAKADRLWDERQSHRAGLAETERIADALDAVTFRYEAKAPTSERPRVNGTAHPTVKPLDLMRWLVRLVTPPGGTVLEPFAGSGTTVEACIIEGFQCIAIEREADYLPLIRQRIDRRRDPVEAIRQRGEDLGLFDHLEGAP